MFSNITRKGRKEMTVAVSLVWGKITTHVDDWNFLKPSSVCYPTDSTFSSYSTHQIHGLELNIENGM